MQSVKLQLLGMSLVCVTLAADLTQEAAIPQSEQKMPVFTESEGQPLREPSHQTSDQRGANPDGVAGRMIYTKNQSESDADVKPVSNQKDLEV